jgi:hypothetical protein
VAKAKDKKQSAAKKASKPRAATAKVKTKRKTVTKAVQGAKKTAAQFASNPAVAEIVAASLVAAAAAIKNPKKARDMAAAVGDELETASKQAVNSGSAFWQLALDIARRSIDALGPDSGRGKAKTGAKTRVKASTKASSKTKAGSKKKARK